MLGLVAFTRNHAQVYLGASPRAGARARPRGQGPRAAARPRLRPARRRPPPRAARARPPHPADARGRARGRRRHGGRRRGARQGRLQDAEEVAVIPRLATRGKLVLGTALHVPARRRAARRVAARRALGRDPRGAARRSTSRSTRRRSCCAARRSSCRGGCRRAINPAARWRSIGRSSSTSRFATTAAASCGSCRPTSSRRRASRSTSKPSATVKRGQQVEVTTTVKPLVGRLPGAARRRADVRRRARPVRHRGVLPEPDRGQGVPAQRSPLRGQPVRAVGGALHEQVGLHHVRRRGLSGELRELREHAHGDPFKFIAWKATARARQLMVRDLENEIVTTHMVLLDVGAGMRAGALGRRRSTGRAIAAAALAKAAVGEQRSDRPRRVRHAAGRRARARYRPSPLSADRRSPARHPQQWSTRISPTSPPASSSRSSRATSRTRRRSTCGSRSRRRSTIRAGRRSRPAPMASSTTSRRPGGCAGG